MSELRFTKDGVPIYDGSPELYVSYKRAALVYAETVEWKKRALVGPRLQAALEGSAKLSVEHMPPGWVSHEKGAGQLLEYLKLQVRAPTLAEAGRTMSRFFYGIKRRRGEGMAAWIVRHDEALLEAKRTLAEAIHEYGPISAAGSTGRGGSHRSRPPLEFGGNPRPPSELGGTTSGGGPSPSGEFNHEEAPAGDIETNEDAEDEEEDGQWTDHWWSSWSWQPYSWGVYSNQDSGWDAWRQKETLSQKTWEVSESASSQAEKFLPDFVIAWLLLQRSGLDATEKSVIVANLKNQFRTDRVKESLKLTWPDEELRRRDSQKHSAMFTAEETAMLADDDDAAEEPPISWDNPDDDYAYQALESEAQEAYAAIQDGRRTLREAREKQAMMRKNRNFYSGKGSGKGFGAPGSSTSSSRPPLKCFSCGGPHLRRDCPNQSEHKGQDQGAHLVFSANQVSNSGAAAEPMWRENTVLAAQSSDNQALLVLDQIIKEGKAIVDGGATSNLGSEEALQQLAALNWQAEGDDGLEIIPGETPSFRFGNNGRRECLSTALLNLRLGGDIGRMKIHLHDIPGQPVLLSIKGLKALGAVIDFSTNEALFKNIDARKVTTLETTTGGHQLFPLAGDVLQGAYERTTPFSSLKTESATASIDAKE